MTWRGGASVVLLSVLVHVPARDAIAQSAMTAEYDVRYGPLTIMALRATTETGDGRYRTTTAAQTVGIAGVIFPWHASATTEGRMGAGGFQPIAHRSSGEYRGQRRSVVMDYDGAGAVVAAIEPLAADDYRDAVPVTLQQDTVDPLTATLIALASHCHGTVRVFDGRRRYDIQLADEGEAEVPGSRGAVYAGPARRCRSQIRPIAGFWRTGPQHDERPSHLDAWVASPRAALPPIPVYLELSNHRGTLSMHLTAVTAAASGAMK